jgi:hypothetical protein
MAREHARIHLGVWGDEDFQDLGAGAQRLYFLLLSQKTINNAGVLPLHITKWARGSKKTTVEDIREALSELVVARFVLVDEHTEEALVRTFIRGDGIAKHPYMLKNALTVARQTESPTLRRALAVELRRLGNPAADQVAAELEATPDRTPPERHSNGIQMAPERQSNAHGEGEGVVPVGTPRSTNVDGSSRRPRSQAKRGTRIPPGFAVTSEMAAWARDRAPSVDGRLETEKFVNYWTAKAGSGATKLDWPATWRNWILTAASKSPNLRAVSGGYQPWRNPAHQDAYDEELI